jgi:hypothetical protein
MLVQMLMLEPLNMALQYGVRVLIGLQNLKEQSGKQMPVQPIGTRQKTGPPEMYQRRMYMF